MGHVTDVAVSRAAVGQALRVAMRYTLRAMYQLRPVDAAPSDYYADVPPDMDPRQLAADHASAHFAEEDAKVADRRTCLVVGIYGLPWSLRYERSVRDADLKGERAMMESVRDEMWTADTLSNGRWSADFGSSWFGLGTPGGDDQLRLYDDRPAVFAVHRAGRESRFSPRWFMATLADGYAFARTLLSRYYGERTVGFAYWRFHNETDAELGLVPDFGNTLVYRAKARSVIDGPAVFAFDDLRDGYVDLIRDAQRRFLERLYDAHEVPRRERQRLEELLAR